MAQRVANRFFDEGGGPTDIYAIIDAVDNRTASLNARSLDSERECLTSSPQRVSADGWPGENLTMWIQCQEEMNDNFFIMFGKRDDVVYLYERGPAVTTMAFIHLAPTNRSAEHPCCYQVGGGGDPCACVDGVCVHESAGANAGTCRTKPAEWPETGNFTSKMAPLMNSTLARVNIYMAIGGGMSPTETGSRGLVHLDADPTGNTFQIAVAGIGFGFCGVQLASDGEVIKIQGSPSGPGGTCLNQTTTCLPTNLNGEVDLSECDVLTFTIAPLGMRPTSDFRGGTGVARWDASAYPGGSFNNVEVGDVDNASVKFGPRGPPPSVPGFNRGRRRGNG
jgi:hypothetical protein